MAFNSNVGRQSFTATSGQTVFDFNFKIFTETDIKVYLTPAGSTPNDATDLLTYGSEYTVTIDGDDGGTVTLLTGATLNDTLVFERVLPRTRDTSYVTNGDLKAVTLNLDQDYQTYMLIDDFNTADRSLSLPSTDVTMSPELPATVPGGFLKVKQDGTGFEYSNDMQEYIDQSTILRDETQALRDETEDFVLGLESVYVDTIADLKLLDPTITTNQKVQLLGYYEKGDGGGGLFYWDSTSTETENGGTIIQATGITTGRWKRVYSGAVNVKWFGANYGESVTKIVPTDFSSISSALEFLSGSVGDFTILLESGYILNEQIILNDSLDYSNITIKSVDSVVNIDVSGITSLTIEKDDIIAFMTIQNGTVAPVIGCLFDYVDNSTSMDAFALDENSKIYFESSDYASATFVSGCRNARRGLTLLNGSAAYCSIEGLTQGDSGLSVGVDFSGCRNRALNIQHGSKAILPKSNFNNSGGDNAVYVIWNSFADLYQSTATGHTGSNAAIHSRDASVVCARETDVSNAANKGYHALHSAMLDARSGVALNCGAYGVLASSASTIDCKEADLTGCYIGIHASDSSSIEAVGANCTNCSQYSAYARGSSKIAFSSGLSTNATIGIYAEDCSSIDADSSSISNCGILAKATGASTINVNGCVNKDNNTGVIAEYASIVNADGVNFQSITTYGIYCSEGSTVQARNIIATGATNNIHCIRGSIVNARGATLTNAEQHGIYCIEGSTVNAQSANTTGAGTFGFYVARGAFVNAGSSIGTLSTTENIITADGVIFK